MSDGIIITAATDGPRVSTDELTTINGAPVSEPVHAQRIKVGFGPDGALQDVDADHPLPVLAALPTGAATAANQTAGNTSLTAIANALAGTLGINGAVAVTNFPATQAISAVSLPLPTGAATAAAQATGNATLTSILTALGTPLQAGGSVSVSNFPATQAISAASLPLPTGAATAAAQATGNASLANLDADVGNVSDAAAPADGTGNYSLVAAVNRALLNWKALFDIFPTSRGQTNMAGSLSIAIASNQSAVNVSPDAVQDSLTTSGSVTSATTIVSVPTAGFMGGSFHVTSAGSATITYEQSNDGVNWDTLAVIRANAPTQQPGTTSTAAGVYRYESPAAFVRARVSAYTSGTVAVTLT